jgi:hypothetical protein
MEEYTTVFEKICHLCGEVIGSVRLGYPMKRCFLESRCEEELPPEHILKCDQFPNAESYLETHHPDFYASLSQDTT